MQTLTAKLWRDFKTVRAALEIAEERIVNREQPDVSDIAVMVWKLTDIPTGYVGPDQKEKGFIIATEMSPVHKILLPVFMPLGVVFHRAGVWMQSNRRGMLELLQLLPEVQQDRLREVAFEEDRIHEPPPTSAREQLRMEQEQRERAGQIQRAFAQTIQQAAATLAAGKSINAKGQITELEIKAPELIPITGSDPRTVKADLRGFFE